MSDPLSHIVLPAVAGALASIAAALLFAWFNPKGPLSASRELADLTAKLQEAFDRIADMEQSIRNQKRLSDRRRG